MVSSGHLGGVLSLWNQYESHMEKINGTRLGWGSGDSPAFCPAQGPVLAHIPGSNLSKLASISSRSQEGDDSMTTPPPSPCFFYHAQPICQDPGCLAPAPGSCHAGEAWLPVAGGLHDSGQMQVCLAKSGSPQRHSIS